MKFSKGDKVILNAEWTKHCSYYVGKYLAGRRATVLGQCRTPHCVRVLFDDQKTPAIFHESFFRK